MLHKPIMITGVETHKYFAVNAGSFEPFDKDEEGRIRVYKDRVSCEAAARLIVGTINFIIVGMGDKKWAEFQRTEKHTLIDKIQSP